ncbi:MAG: hypothetical protein PHG97_06420 [Candidatus Margulisbacteria bacterium]|nr:hypothetical protein [Candidatus Margulisiibacteriota bacterium]
MNINGSARIGWRTATIAALGLASLSCVRGAKPAAAASQATAPQVEAFYGGRAVLIEGRCQPRSFALGTIDGVPSNPVFRITPGEIPTKAFSLRVNGWIKPVAQNNNYIILGIRLYNPEPKENEKRANCCWEEIDSLSLLRTNQANNNYVTIDHTGYHNQCILPKNFVIELFFYEPVETSLTVEITPKSDLRPCTINNK